MFRTPPNDVRGFVHKRIIGAVGGFIGGGPQGALKGFFGGGGGSRRGRTPRPSDQFQILPVSSRMARQFEGGPIVGFDASGSPLRQFQAQPHVHDGGPLQPSHAVRCIDGFELRNGKCVRVSIAGRIASIAPFGRTPTEVSLFGLASPTARDVPVRATVGAFGMPASEPEAESRQTLRCPRGMVLAIDNLCYPKAVLSRRNKFRKWRQPPRPTLSRRDEVAIRRAASAKDRVLALAKEAGLHASKTRPTSRKKHAHAIGPIEGGLLKLISESTN